MRAKGYLQAVGLLLVFGAIQGSSAAAVKTGADKLSASDCAQLSNPDARLSCFDQVFGTDSSESSTEPGEPGKKAPEVSTVDVEATPSKPAPAQSVVSTTPAVTGSEPVNAPAVTKSPAREKPPRAPLLGGMFDRKDQLSLTSRIKAVRDQDQQRMAFMLENEEVWIQTSPRNLPFKEGDDVTIKSGLMGGYVMRTSGGVSTRVKRIK